MTRERVSTVLEVAGVVGVAVGVLLVFGVGWAVMLSGAVAVVFGVALGGPR